MLSILLVYRDYLKILLNIIGLTILAGLFLT